MRLLILFILLSASATTYGQKKKNKVDFKLLETELNLLCESITETESDESRIKTSKKFNDFFKEVLSKEKSFNYDFTSIVKLKQLTPKDKSFKLYSWATSFEDGSYTYHAIVQRYDKKNKRYVLTSLKDNSANTVQTTKKILSPKNWWGAYYYDVSTMKSKGKTYYILLGWDGNNKLSNKKVIEPMSFSKSGRIKFGANIFKVTKGYKKRILFEFSSDVVMSLKFHDKQKLIVFDHLAPLASNLSGERVFYGPDLSYDAFELKKGKWHLVSNIKINNEERPNTPLPKQPKPKKKTE